jgi:hypothetical protein
MPAFSSAGVHTSLCFDITCPAALNTTLSSRSVARLLVWSGALGPLVFPKVWRIINLARPSKIRNLVEIKACEKFYRRHMVDIPRIKF